VDGVPVYEGTVLFTDTDTRIRSGMTATVTIIVGQKTDVIAVPTDYIREDKVLQKYFVNVVSDIDDNKIREQEVKIGIRGSDGMTEIINGLVGGETLTSIIKKK
jgi:multidrug efflux pump subunit AcrA (membrane-fusion protein)